MRAISRSASQIIVEQLAASGVRYVFNNPGSREALFFDALASHPDIHGIMSLHEGTVAAMAGGYAQANTDTAVMSVHLGAGLAQSLGQMINVWNGSLPVVVITFAGDTGSFGDKVGLDLSHSFGPTSIAAPFTKSTWTVIEPEGLPQAIDRALLVAGAPPVGPVHLAVYDRILTSAPVDTAIIEGRPSAGRAGYPSDADVEEIVDALTGADRPMLHVGDGAWKSGAGEGVAALAEMLGAPISGDTRVLPIRHPLHCGSYEEASARLEPDVVVCVGVRQNSRGLPGDFAAFAGQRRILAIGHDSGNLKNIPGLQEAVLADESRAIERMLEAASGRNGSFGERRAWAAEQASILRARRREAVENAGGPQDGLVRPWVLGDALDDALEDAGGGMVMIEQFAVPLDAAREAKDAPRNVYVRPAGGSEGYGIGGTIGLKLGAPDRPVVGLVGDGSVYYADSGLWSAAHHRVPVLFVIPNNRAYGIVANSYQRAGGAMSDAGNYAGVALEGIDIVKLSESFGVEGRDVTDEATVEAAIAEGLATVERERRPMLLNVHLPQGLPAGGRAVPPFELG